LHLAHTEYIAYSGILHHPQKVLDTFHPHKNKPIEYPPIKNGFKKL